MISQMAGWHGVGGGVGGSGGGGGQTVAFTCHVGAISSHEWASFPFGSVQSFVLLLSHLPLRNIVRML